MHIGVTPRRLAALGALGLLTVAPTAASAQLRLSRLVGDHMVLQRDVAVPVWGWARVGDTVRVAFGGSSYDAVANPDGAWRVTLPAMPAGGPHEMTVAAGGSRLRVRDILVGDVWVASGQSNMEWPVAEARDAAREIAAAGDTRVRHVKVPQSWAAQPEDSLAGGEWTVADPAHVGAFSAVGYFFARDLRRHVDVPIGILNTSWGGSRIEPWMSREALRLDPAALDEVMRRERAAEQEARDALRARVGGELPARDPGLVNGRAVWASPALDDAAWATIPVPGVWEQAGYAGMDGVAWYRTTFELTAAEARAGVRLGLGQIDDADVTWVNGREVGRTSGWNVPRVYDVPAVALRPGRNVVAVRVEDTGGGGGVHGDPGLFYVEARGGRATRRPLDGAWRFRVGAVELRPDGQRINKLPTLLYNKMVHPLLPYPIRGVLWYQGESNADRLEDAAAYRATFPALIADWRARWASPRRDFPFLWVQLANFMAADAEPAERSAWATLRESQGAALRLPNTAQVVAIDLGEAGDIHPRNKQDVGARLALAARKVAYGHDVVHSGPVYRRHEVRDGRVVIEFDHVGGGLAVGRRGGGSLRGFAVAGADRRFVWADARIEGDRVVVRSDRVAEPVAVRYAWGDNPDAASLYNAAGLPAAPFRTDAW